MFATTETNAEGTYLQGFLYTTMYRLAELFGEPTHFSDDEKVKVEWILEHDDILIAIYDWKNPQRPEIFDDYEWHIGARQPKDIERFFSYFPELERKYTACSNA